MKNIFGKDKPEDLADRDLRVIIDRMMDDSTFEHALIDRVRSAFITDINTRQIVLDKVNTLLDEILCNEDNYTKIKEAVIRQIDELHNVKILLDRIPHSKVESVQEYPINRWHGHSNSDFANSITSMYMMSESNFLCETSEDVIADKQHLSDEVVEIREEIKRRFK